MRATHYSKMYTYKIGRPFFKVFLNVKTVFQKLNYVYFIRHQTLYGSKCAHIYEFVVCLLMRYFIRLDGCHNNKLCNLSFWAIIINFRIYLMCLIEVWKGIETYMYVHLYIDICYRNVMHKGSCSYYLDIASYTNMIGTRQQKMEHYLWPRLLQTSIMPTPPIDFSNLVSVIGETLEAWRNKCTRLFIKNIFIIDLSYLDCCWWGFVFIIFKTI